MPTTGNTNAATGAGFVRYGLDPSNNAGVGGEVEFFTAGANLNVGDVVYISADNTVNKSTSAANQSNMIGVVVGGQLTGMQASDDSTVVGRQAADTVQNTTVMVLVRGRAWVVTDGAIAAGVPLCASTTTAGRVRAATATVIAPGAVAVTSVAANGALDITGDGANTIIGTMRVGTAGQGIGLALICGV